MIPSRRLIYLLWALTALGFAAGLLADLLLLWQGAGLALLSVGVLDAWISRKPPRLRVERQLAGVWPVDKWNDATLSLHNEDTRALVLEAFDDYPQGWRMEGMPHATRIEPGRFVAVRYRLCPDKRGDAVFGAAHISVASPFGLWQRTYRMGREDTVKVFPDFSRLLGYALNATDRRAPVSGAIRKRRRGEGTDFRQLREYRQGDSMRAIDWKATARQLKPISREYQEERDQQVVFLLDTGRRMLAKDGAATHFDHALDAVLTLSFVAQKQGDAVGLMTFGQETRWLGPQKGRVGLDRLLAGMYDLQAGEIAPDYELAASALLRKLSNVRDEDDRSMRTACELLSSRHLVMCASLREKALDVAFDAPVEQFADALRLCAAAHYLDQRNEAIRRLGIRAAQLIDVTPDKLSMTLVNRYFEIKESGQL
jgi:uncharacterized protein (DUF58 family)